jgi:hypothetical protein
VRVVLCDPPVPVVLDSPLLNDVDTVRPKLRPTVSAPCVMLDDVPELVDVPVLVPVETDSDSSHWSVSPSAMEKPFTTKVNSRPTYSEAT